MITQDSIEALRARLDIVDVIGGYLELRKNGANYKAPCPFHDEKSPSFVVSPQKQIYHCFGCGAGGDSIKFVMEKEKLSYPEALEKLASTYNFSLSYTDNKHQKRVSTKLLESLNEWYQSLLNNKPSALNYLKERGIFESSIEKFGIGFAPASHETINYIRAKLFTMKEAVELGVAGDDGSRAYARFIERITFPIHASNGTNVGFGGRTITGHQAKYINSPQTVLFNKSRLLYAYHLAKDAIHKKRELIVTEGYLDVVMLHQAGFTQAVATLGTALTPEHLPLLRKGDPKIIMAYDGDKAGRKKKKKASKLLSVAGFSGGVVLFGEGLDPADMVKNGQLEELNNLFRSPKSFIEFVLDQILLTFDMQDPKEKEKALSETSAYLKTLTPLLQEEYKRYLAAQLAISPSFIKLSQSSIEGKKELVVENRGSDVFELSLIKTLLEQPALITQTLDIIDISLIRYHQEEFQALISGENAHPRLMAVSINDSIPCFENFDALKLELCNILSRYYSNKIKHLMRNNALSFEHKNFYNRKYRNYIIKLKKGQLVPFESN